MRRTFAKAVETHKKLVAMLETECAQTVISAAEMIVECLQDGGTIYICGNGGSAADAQHIAAELVGRFKRPRKALPALALTTDTSIITSVANDYTFNDIFTRQLEAFIEPNDILWTLSTSGTSANILAAAEFAGQKGASVLAFTGKGGSALEEISDLCLCIDAPDTASAQEIHQLAYHIICDLVESSFCDK